MKTSESIIQSDGSLRIVVHREKLSWFDFLGYSRASRARDMGWNSKSYWNPRGVDVLARDNAIIPSRWAEHSLKPEVEPLPRERNFMFNRKDSVDRLALRDVGTAESVSENALSFRKFEEYRDAEGKDRLLGRIDLIGYEIPLARTKARQLKIDLLGVSSDPVPAIEIIELKDGDNTGDSPLMALTEAICYALQVLRCKDALLRVIRDWRATETELSFRNINLHLMAPKQYWDTWFRDPAPRPAIEADLRRIVEGVNIGIKSSGLASSLTVSFQNI